MQIAIISDSPCERLLQAVERAQMQPVVTEANLENFAGYILLKHTQTEILQQTSKPILGIGKGAEYLVASGLVPGVENFKPVITFTPQLPKNSVRIHPTVNYQYNAFTRHINRKTCLSLEMDIQKQFVIPAGLQLELQENGLLVFQEKDGSVMAISNRAGNVMAILPHPESHIEGDVLFKSMREYIVKGYQQRVAPLAYYPR